MYADPYYRVRLLRYKEGKAYPKEVYTDDNAYFTVIAKAYQADLRVLYEHGLRNVQFDDLIWYTRRVNRTVDFRALDLELDVFSISHTASQRTPQALQKDFA